MGIGSWFFYSFFRSAEENMSLAFTKEGWRKADLKERYRMFKSLAVLNSNCDNRSTEKDILDQLGQPESIESIALGDANNRNRELRDDLKNFSYSMDSQFHGPVKMKVYFRGNTLLGFALCPIITK